jgi:hypothetical protein
MTIASRTPEGDSHQCLICGGASCVETSDSVCPRCSSLVSRLREDLPAFPARFTAADLERPLGDFVDSMEFVELMLAWEDRHPDLASLAAANQIQTITDVLHWLRDHGGTAG